MSCMRLHQQGGHLLPYVRYSPPKAHKVLGTLAGDDATHNAFAWAAVGYPTAVAAFPTVVAKKAGTVDGAPASVANTSKALAAREAKALEECSPATAVANTLIAPVAKEAKVSKECSLVMADFVAPTDAEVVAKPAPVPQAPGPFHPTSVVVDNVGAEMNYQGRSCEEHRNCGEVMGKDVVVRLWKVQIQVEGWEETAIAAYWVTDGINRCHVDFLECNMVKQATCFNGALVQVTCVFSVDPTCCDTAECRAFHKNKGCCRAAIIVWYKK
jgi:hypothetical protein